MHIQCRTLFDITATGITGHLKPSRMPFVDQAGQKITDSITWNRSRNQQRNWETLTQLISLRTQVIDLTQPEIIDNQWQFEFTVDNDNLFLDNDDSLAVLKNDCQGVPMLIGLGELASIDPVLVNDQNIWFTLTSINKI
jgi:hypothetical protein